MLGRDNAGRRSLERDAPHRPESGRWHHPVGAMSAAFRMEATPMARLRLLLASAMLGTLLLVPATAANAAPTTSPLSIPVSGTVAGVSSFVG